MKTKHDGKQISPGSIKQMQEKGVKIMYRKEKKMAAKKAGSLLTGGVLMAALALGQISPAMVYAEDGETSLSVAEAQAEEEQGAEEKAEYTQLETTNISDVSVSAIDVSSIVEAVMPSMVTITEYSVQEVMNYFGGPQQMEVEGAATGFIIAQDDDEIMIATNNHVVTDSTDVSVCFYVKDKDGEEVVAPAKVKGTDPATDLAVIAVSPDDIPDEVLSELKIAVLGSSDNLKIGQTAITIGNALGLGLNVTSGIISALDVEVNTDSGSWTEFQTDGASNNGQSGGAVFNADGEVIGIFNAGAVYGDNMGCAIPVSVAIPVLQNLINRETRDALEDHGYLGVTVVPVSDEASEMYNIPQGAYIYEVAEGSGAEEAGLQKGDIITGLDGLTIDSQATLLRQITYYEAGETVEVKVMRPTGTAYEEQTFDVTLQAGGKDADDEGKESGKKGRGKKDRDEIPDEENLPEEESEDWPSFDDLYPDAPEGLGDIFDEIFGGGHSSGNGEDYFVSPEGNEGDF
jgi:serine protease Do